jgi:ribokinase
MSRIVVTGYASLDYSVRLDGKAEADRTTRIVSRSERAWPRLGGSPAHVALALVRHGVRDVLPVTWIGSDIDGSIYLERLGHVGIALDGVERARGRTPICILAYQPDGGCVCLYDAGLDGEPELSKSQFARIAAAEWVCLTVGPPAVSAAVLEAINDSARLVWAVKADPHAFTGDLANRIAARADVISFSRRERGFVEAALTGRSRPGRALIETRGAEGARVEWDGQSADVVGKPVSAPDPTGAGDTFVGGVIAALIQGSADPREAVAAGIAAARQLLLSR